METVCVDWSALREIPPGEYGQPRGYCEDCGLYIWSDGALKVPGIRGLLCSVLCFECTLFGFGRCRWCGEKLSGAGKFCSESHRKQSNETRFGDGTRLLNYLARRHPGLHRRLFGQGQAACLACGDPLNSKRADARFCSDRCKKAYQRKSATSSKSGNSRDTDLVESVAYGGPENSTVLPPTELGFGDIRD